MSVGSVAGAMVGGVISAHVAGVALTLTLGIVLLGSAFKVFGGRRVTQWRRVIMRLSARNVFKGRIVEVVRGATTAHVRIDLGSGVVVTASITNEAVDALRLAAGDAAYAVVKASDVMIGKD